MTFLKKHPLFCGVLGLSLLIFLALAGLTVLENARLSRDEDRIRRLRQELASAAALETAPTEENLAKSAKNVEQLTRVLEQAIAVSRGKRSVSLDQVPQSASDLFLDLEAFRGSMQRAADEVEPLFANNAEGASDGLRLQVPEGFSFGFATFLDSGRPPEDPLVEVVYKQKEILAFLLRRLFEAEPYRLLEVQREPAEQVRRRLSGESTPSTAGQTASRNRFNPDQFEIDPSRSLRVPGSVDTLAFRIRFVGYTQSLRPFLKALERFELPVVVRSVEVTPYDANSVDRESRSGRNAGGAGSRSSGGSSLFDFLGGSADEADETQAEADESESVVKVVSENFSDFVVIVEYIDVKVTADATPNSGMNDDLLEEGA